MSFEFGIIDLVIPFKRRNGKCFKIKTDSYNPIPPLERSQFLHTYFSSIKYLQWGKQIKVTTNRGFSPRTFTDFRLTKYLHTSPDFPPENENEYISLWLDVKEFANRVLGTWARFALRTDSSNLPRAIEVAKKWLRLFAIGIHYFVII